MAHQEHAGSGLARSVGEQSVASLTGGGGQTARWLLALPAQRLEPNAEARGDGAAPFGPSGARRLQAVIHRQRHDAAPMRVRPFFRQQQQRQRVPAARKRHG